MHITSADGLTNNIVRSIAQDSLGYIWFSTSNGLNRYNGYEIINYYHNYNDPNSIPNDQVYKLFTDPFGNLWIGTKNGICRYNYEQDNFVNYKIQFDSLRLDKIITDIQSDTAGICYFSTKSGHIYQYNSKRDSFQDFNIGLNEKIEIAGIFFDKENTLYVGCMNKLGIFKKDTLEFIPIDKEKYDFSIPLTITSFQNNIWLTIYPTGTRIFDQNEKRIKKTPYSLINDVFAMAAYNEDNKKLWLSATDKLMVFIPSEKKVFSYTNDIYDDESLSYNGTSYFYKDKHSNYWVGTAAGGINVALNDKKFRLLRSLDGTPVSLSNTDVTSICQGPDNNIYISFTTGLDVFSPDLKNKIYSFESKKSDLGSGTTYDIITWRNELFICNYEKGLQKLQSNKKYFSAIDLKGSVENRDARSIDIDKDGFLWIVYHGQGVLKTNLSDVYQVYNQENNNLIDNWNNQILIDTKNNKWVESELGLSVLFNKEEQFTNFFSDPDNPYSLSSNEINKIFEDSEQRVWIGTSNGLCLFIDSARNFVRINAENGFPYRNISAVNQDDSGNLWITVKKGIVKFNSKNFCPFTDKVENRITFFNLSNKSLYNEFTGASCHSSDGIILFGGNKGVTYFYPKQITPNPVDPDIYITEIKVNNQLLSPGDSSAILDKHISFTGQIELNYTQNALGFTFTAINFLHSNNNQYAYILEGLDKGGGWNFIGTKRHITFTNLAPGKYILKVKAANNDGIWSKKIREINIVIHPPWYQTWWMKLIFASGTIFLLFFFIRLKTNWMKQQEERELNRLKIKFFMNISHEFRTPLSLILGPVENILNKDPKTQHYQQLQLIYRNTKRLLRLINQLLDLRKLETRLLKLSVIEDDIVKYTYNIYSSFIYLAQRQNIKYKFSSASDGYVCAFDPEIIEKSLYNLISNAFKYTPKDGSITVTVDVVKNNSENNKSLILKTVPADIDILHVSVSDTGIGIDSDTIPLIFQRFYRANDSVTKKQSGTGIGLALTKEFIEIHKGIVKVDSRKDFGSSFSIYIPVTYDYYPKEEKATINKGNENIDYYPHITDDNDLKAGDSSVSNPVKSHDETEIILIVDDNPEILIFIRDLLQNDYTIIQASNGKSGLELARKKIPDLIISDVMMPEMDGLEFCKNIKSHVLTSHIPVILLTAKSSEENQLEGLDKGANDYIVKPFNIEILKAKVHNVLESRRKFKEKFKRTSLDAFSEIPMDDIDTEFMAHFMDCIEKNFSRHDFGNQQICQEMGLSNSQLFRKVKALTNHSPGEFLRQTRLGFAKKLLDEKVVHNVSQAAYKSGFNDPKYFSKCFKEQYNFLPSKYFE